jgi:CAAX protease family protein
VGSRVRWLFLGPFGLRAGWRAGAFVLVVAALVIAWMFGFRSLRLRLPEELGLALAECGVLGSVLAATWLLARIERRPFTAFGLRGPNRLRNGLVGVAAGFLALSSLMAVLGLAGAAHLGPITLRGREALMWGCFWAAVFVMVGFAEEMMMRGYLLHALSQGIGFWPATVATSLLFGAGHLRNEGEALMGLASAALIGIVNAYSLRWSGSLWWAIGLHASWDWGETFFYGVADSGRTVGHHLLSIAPAGPGWLSGGAVGPEGSVLVLLVLVVLFFSVHKTLSAAGAPGLERVRGPAAG